MTSAARPDKSLRVRKRYLIVCEGEQTEPKYFEAFHAPGVVLQVEGTGYNTESLVDEAIRIKEEAEAKIAAKRLKQFDQCWCVFDCDDFGASKFNNAISKAKANGFHVAFSNEAFELWYLLHFNYHDTQLNRASYKGRLQFHLKRPCKKNDPDIYTDILPYQKVALRNAKKLHTMHKGKTPEHSNPCTTVYKLVEELNKNVPPDANTP